MSCIEDKLKEMHQNDREQLDINFLKKNESLLKHQQGAVKQRH